MVCVQATVYAIFVVIFAFVMYNHPLTKQSPVGKIGTAISTLISGFVWSWVIYYMCQRGGNYELLAWVSVIGAIAVAILMVTFLPKVSETRKH